MKQLVTLDTKLTWNILIRKLIDHGMKRLAILKRMTSAKWGTIQDALCLSYKLYVQPVMEHEAKIIAIASETSLKKLNLVQN